MLSNTVQRCVHRRACIWRTSAMRNMNPSAPSGRATHAQSEMKPMRARFRRRAAHTLAQCLWSVHLCLALGPALILTRMLKRTGRACVWRTSAMRNMNLSAPSRRAMHAQSEMNTVRARFLGCAMRAKMMPSVTASSSWPQIT